MYVRVQYRCEIRIFMQWAEKHMDVKDKKSKTRNLLDTVIQIQAKTHPPSQVKVIFVLVKSR